MTENEISYQVIGAIYKVYNELGPGLLESVYEAALCYQLRKDGLKVENQVKLPVMYDGQVLPVDLRLDVLVEDKVIVELKSVAEMKAVYGKQLLTYLKISHLKLGLLVNFDTSDIRSSIHRVVNHL
ncbi:GxxExxY protein [Prevotella copri]|uniref:GxxExxY protein n=1 Tax=Segatella copri TaxID=165179 RepID=UPI001F256111|nr:GxxExxY protein [Segatella copri]MCF2609662.1 GxxExxY protein [Segatella copri]